MQNRKLVIDCAELSSHIYDTVIPQSINGWKLLTQLATGGYKGACYYNEETTPLKIAFVHRGTVFSYIENIFDDVKLAMEKMPDAEFESAMTFLNTAWMEVGKKFGKEKLKKAIIIQTGHSLGAATASLCHVATTHIEKFEQKHLIKNDFDLPLISTESIEFENPGVKPQIFDFLSKRNLSTKEIEDILPVLAFKTYIYQARPNVINTCNAQVGNIFQLRELSYRFDINHSQFPYAPIPSKYKLNSFYLISNTQDQHEMANILDYLISGNEITQLNMRDYPFGFQNGYIFYLEQNNWDNYFKYIWNREADTREQYKNDFQKYLTAKYQQLSEAINAAHQLIQFQSDKGVAKVLPFFNSKIVNFDPIGDFILVDKDESKQESTYKSCIQM